MGCVLPPHDKMTLSGAMHFRINGHRDECWSVEIFRPSLYEFDSNATPNSNPVTASREEARQAANMQAGPNEDFSFLVGDQYTFARS